MLAARSKAASTLSRLLLLSPQRFINTIGRRPRSQAWLAAPAPAADGSRGKPAAAAATAAAAAAFSNSSSGTGSSGRPVSADRTQASPDRQPDPSADYADLLQPQPGGSFLVTAKELQGKGKVRLDAYLSAQLPDASRAKISASIKAGLICINTVAVSKPSYTVKAGDHIVAALLPPEPCTAIPQAIPLNVVFEDDHLIVVNKEPGMVVHLSPGHTTGTLVNALLAHCGLPACDAIPSGSSGSSGSGVDGAGGGGGLFSGQAGLVLGGVLQNDDLDEAEELFDEAVDVTGFERATAAPASSRAAAPAGSKPNSTGAVSSGNNSTSISSSGGTSSGSSKGIIRPGIVHRLDRGTSGLMVVAKTDAVHAALCQQFKERSVSRIYNSITVGVPEPQAARVATNIVRDPGNRLRMMAVPYGSSRGRTAASNYQTLEVVAGGGAAVVQWRLETGRTHQIRVHAKHVGHPLLGDDMYGPNHAASSRQVVGKRSSLAAAAKAAVEGFGRPALHAKTLGFTHPVTRQRLEFDSEWPADFRQMYDSLREWS